MRERLDNWIAGLFCVIYAIDLVLNCEGVAYSLGMTQKQEKECVELQVDWLLTD